MEIAEAELGDALKSFIKMVCPSAYVLCRRPAFTVVHRELSLKYQAQLLLAFGSYRRRDEASSWALSAAMGSVAVAIRFSARGRAVSSYNNRRQCWQYLVVRNSRLPSDCGASPAPYPHSCLQLQHSTRTLCQCRTSQARSGRGQYPAPRYEVFGWDPDSTRKSKRRDKRCPNNWKTKKRGGTTCPNDNQPPIHPHIAVSSSRSI